MQLLAHIAYRPRRVLGLFTVNVNEYRPVAFDDGVRLEYVPAEEHLVLADGDKRRVCATVESDSGSLWNFRGRVTAGEFVLARSVGWVAGTPKYRISWEGESVELGPIRLGHSLEVFGITFAWKWLEGVAVTYEEHRWEIPARIAAAFLLLDLSD